MSNRLANEKSPYLLQHANNPVDWYPWGDEAFRKAQQEDKPVFLSIGYSTCHWCHVMERESFEDEEVAGILNSHFVPVKVDREERPDVDTVYMSVCHAMTGHGGWPLTVILTPDKKPFFAGTYFPKRSKRGMPGIMEILDHIQEKWAKERFALTRAGERITQALQLTPVSSTDILSGEAIRNAYEQFRGQYDQQYGGFGRAPKFPAPHNLLFLTRYWKTSGEKQALTMVEKTLESMYSGGIYDHIGYGFSRYSTDEKWLVPHFEKMLYDNAMLALAYLEAYQATGKDFYAGVARDIFAYVLRDMKSPEGAFYSAEDADSEGVEGKFYIWLPGEVKEILGERDGDIYCRLYGITEQGNFEGHSIPNLLAGFPHDVAGEFGMEPGQLKEHIEKMRQKLFAARRKRVPPFKDDKILTSWNGLIIAALGRGAAVLDEQDYLAAAVRAAEFIDERLKREDGRLLARYRDGEAAYPAYLDDYAYLTWGMLELYGATFQAAYIEKALKLMDQAIELFWDGEHGGFYFTGTDAEELLLRPKEVFDNALPSGNSVALSNLLRLAKLTGDTNLLDKAEGLIKAFAMLAGEYPRACAYFLTGLSFYLGPAREVVVAGEAGDDGLQKSLQLLSRTYLPQTVVIYRPAGEEAGDIIKLAPFLEGKRPVDNLVTTYVCQDYACLEPVSGYDRLLETMQNWT